VESSAEDWQREARRLELQGKLEQAEQIRRDVLGIRPVPWPITDVPAVGQLALDAFLGDLPGRFLGLDGALGTKAVCQRAFEIAITCRLPQWITRLRIGGFKHAKRAEAGRQFIEQTHYLEFGFRRSPTLFRQIAAHGVDFRNPLNETPLMVAARLGRGELAREFLELGADPDVLDNLGRSALQIALEQWSDEALRPAALVVMHGVLAGSSMRLVIDGRMTKLEPSSGEWLLWQVCLMHYRKELAKFAGGDRTLQGMLPSFSAVDLARVFEELPRDLVPDHRRARTYISALLSKNEHHADSPRNKRLFVRLRQGQYALNPHLSLHGRAGTATLAELIGLPLWRAIRRPDSQRLDDLLDTTWQIAARFARSRRKPSSEPGA
jgi:hypothetical protein